MNCELCSDPAQSMFRVQGGLFDWFGCGKHAIFIRKLLAEFFPGKLIDETLVGSRADLWLKGDPGLSIPPP